MNSKINEIVSKLKLIKCNDEVFLDLVSKRFRNSKILIKYINDYTFDSNLLNSGNYYLINEFKKYLLFEEKVDSYYCCTAFPGIKLDIDVIDSFLSSSIFKPRLKFEINLFKIAWVLENYNRHKKILNVYFFLSDLIKLYEENNPLELNLKFGDYISKKQSYLIKLLKAISKSNLIQLFDKKISIRGFLGVIKTIFSKDDDFILIKTMINNVKNNLKSYYVSNSKMKLYELLNFVLYYARKYFVNLFCRDNSDFDRYFNFINTIVMNTELFEGFIKINEL